MGPVGPVDDLIDEAGRQVVGELAVALLADPQGLFRPPSPGDIPRHGQVGEATGGVAEGDRVRLHPAARAADADDLELQRPPLTPADPLVELPERPRYSGAITS